MHVILYSLLLVKRPTLFPLCLDVALLALQSDHLVCAKYSIHMDKGFWNVCEFLQEPI